MDNKLITSKQLKLNHYCYGLAYKDNKLFISDSKTALYIYDINGTLLKKSQLINKAMQFSMPKKISVLAVMAR
jgi:hypothetical protein